MNDSLFTDEPAPEKDSLFTDTPAPEIGLFGQPLGSDTTSQHGWDITAGKPIPMAPESEVRNEPGLQDVSVPDALAIQGAAGLAKGAAGLGGKLLARGAGEVLPENLVETVGRVSDNQMLKSTGGSMGQIRQVGPEAARAAAKVGREAGLGDILSNEIGREKALANLDRTTGQKIGALRQEAGNAPVGIPEKIAAHLESKYGTGGVYSGEAGGLKKALADVERVGSQTKPLPVIEQPLKTGEPHALFDYNDPITGKSSYKVYGDPALTGIKTTGNLPLDQLGNIKVVGKTTKAAELGQEPLDLPGAPPTHAGYANAATYLNKYATGEKLKQPVNAATDVANALSRENNAGIVQTLGSDKGQEYLKALSDEKAYKVLEQFFNRGELREMAGRGGVRGLVQQAIQSLANKGGYRAVSKMTNLLHDAMTSPVDLAGTASQAVTSGSKMVPAALNDFLSQKYGKTKENQ